MPRRDRLLRRFLGLEGADKVLAIEAAALLVCACALVRWPSGRWLVRWLRREGTEGTELALPCTASGGQANASADQRLCVIPCPPSSPMSPNSCGAAARLLAMIDRVARLHPLRPLCLEQALAGRWLLARHGIASRIAIGVKGPVFEAHAWLELSDSGSPEGLPRTGARSSSRGIEAPSAQVVQGFGPASPLTSGAGYHAIWRA